MTISTSHFAGRSSFHYKYYLEEDFEWEDYLAPTE